MTELQEVCRGLRGWTVAQGDCLETMKELPDNSVDLIACDLPYGTTSCKWDTIIPFESLWVEYKRTIKSKGAIVLMACQPFTSALVMSNPAWFKYELVWNKLQTGAPGTAKYRPLPCHETVLVFGNGRLTYNPQMSEGTPYRSTTRCGGNRHGYGSKGKFYRSVNEGVRFPLSILPFRKERHPFHATQKPVALMDYLIRTYSNEGELVLDNCCGSGSTGVAAQKTGRRFIGIELSSDYCTIARQRIEAAASLQPVAQSLPLFTEEAEAA